MLKRIGKLLLSLATVMPLLASAIEAEDILDYGDVFIISGLAPERNRLVVSWDIARGYYLYNNQFLSFESATEGVVLGEPVIPPGEVSFDELLGQEVAKYHNHVSVTIPVTFVERGIDAMQLRVRSQGCLEDVLCYPPTTQVVLIGFPRAQEVQITPAPPPNAADTKPLENVTNDPLAGLGDVDSEPLALEPEEAFQYEAIGLSPEMALVRFTSQPGYYLYRDKFSFTVVSPEGISVLEASLPEGAIKDDPEFGEVQVFFDQVEIPVRLDRAAGPAEEVTLKADFQGCRDGDICYPPMSREVTFDLEAASTDGGEMESVATVPPTGTQVLDPLQAPDVPVSEQDRLARALTNSPVGAIFLFFLAGLLLAFTPCVFPMVPILSGIIAGEGENLTTRRAFWLSLVYVLAMAVTYTVAGVLAGLFGQNLQAVFQNPWILSVFVAVFVFLALSMFGLYKLQLPVSWQSRLAQISSRQVGGRFTGVAVMGFLSALIVGPCVAPPLMAALIVIGSSGDAVLGGTALFSLSLGMGAPLVVFGTTAGRILPMAGKWMEAVMAVFGVGLLALGIWLLERILPGGLIMVLWGMLAVGCGVYMGGMERVPPYASGWRRLQKSLGVVLLLIGAMELAGAALGGDNWLRPLDRLGGGNVEPASHVEFRRIKSVDDLDAAIAQANAAGKGAMLDFYADWCVECIRMERNTFPEPEVQALLDRMQLLQADVTEHDETDQALMARFGIIGPPAIMFFDQSGEEMQEFRLFGYFTPEEFSSHLRAVVAAQ